MLHLWDVAEKTENYQTVENTDVMDLVELRTDEQREEETFFSHVLHRDMCAGLECW